MRLLARPLLAFVALLVLALPAAAREEITSFDSSSVLATDGTVDVTETIAVNAEGDQIRHGIFRDIFTVLRNDDGSKFYSSLKVSGVQLNGQDEPYTTEGISNGERIKIGDADHYIDQGPNTFVIHYTMTRMARFFPDHDEFYWNATGNFWDFPIVSATATVKLPPGATISKVAAYTGPVGSTGQDATSTRTGDNTAAFRSTRELGPGEGMTIAVAFQKGIVVPASGPGDWLSDHRDSVLPPVAVLIALLYNLFAWNKVGRDPKKGTIIPLFHPPEGLSPATTQWVHRQGFKGNGWDAFTAGIFDLGVRGLVTVDNTDKQLTVTATDAKPSAPLPADEQVLYDYFARSGAITINRSNGPTLDGKRAAMLGAITGPNRGLYFSSNALYTFGGVVIGLLCLVAMVVFRVLDPGWLLAAVVGGGIIGVLIAIFRRGAANAIFGLGFAAIWLAVAGVNMLGSLGGLFHSGVGELIPALAALSIIVVTGIFAYLMRAPTIAGRKLMDQIDGFLMYLNTAEKNRLNLAGEPPMTVNRFESILPFAIALGVEKPWASKFNAALAAGAVAGVAGAYYAPAWYSGGNFSSDNISSNIAAISTGMSAAMASSVPQSSSSSGFSGGGGGGGSSGGGGGGGGGGGW